MSTDGTPPRIPSRGRGPKLTSAQAQARLADALRANLKRRKAQVRARDQASTGPTADDEAGPSDEGKTR